MLILDFVIMIMKCINAILIVFHAARYAALRALSGSLFCAPVYRSVLKG